MIPPLVPPEDVLALNDACADLRLSIIDLILVSDINFSKRTTGNDTMGNSTISEPSLPGSSSFSLTNQYPTLFGEQL